MYSDLTIANKVSTLDDYYKLLYLAHSKAHGSGYVLVHKEIKSLLKRDMTYTELGINQGATLAAAMLNKPKKVAAYDICLKPYNFAAHLFHNYASENNIDFHVEEANSHKIKINNTDILYIDTVHRKDHLHKELKLHSKNVNKFIIFHDTMVKKQILRGEVLSFLSRSKEWSLLTDCKDNVGYMSIKRI